MADESFLQAIEEFKAFQGSKEALALDICGVYKKVKPILSGILPFLKLIPVYGGTVVAALTALMAAADKLCPGS
jgi:hypothetical protein